MIRMRNINLWINNELTNNILFSIFTDADELDAFDVDMSTGDIRLVKALDSVQQSHYRLLVEASVDSDPPKSDTAEVSFV